MFVILDTIVFFKCYLLCNLNDFYSPSKRIVCDQIKSDELYLIAGINSFQLQFVSSNFVKYLTYWDMSKNRLDFTKG